MWLYIIHNVNKSCILLSPALHDGSCRGTVQTSLIVITAQNCFRRWLKPFNGFKCSHLTSKHFPLSVEESGSFITPRVWTCLIKVIIISLLWSKICMRMVHEQRSSCVLSWGACMCSVDDEPKSSRIMNNEYTSNQCHGFKAYIFFVFMSFMANSLLRTWWSKYLLRAQTPQSSETYAPLWDCIEGSQQR